jgi:hypothetical protein
MHTSKSSRTRLLISFLAVLSMAAPVTACDSGPSDDADTDAATAKSVRPPQAAPAPAPSGSLPDPDDSCLAGCLRQWQACLKSRRPRPDALASSPTSGADDCVAAAGQCVSACPARTDAH